jgi:hypothetical protein
MSIGKKRKKKPSKRAKNNKEIVKERSYKSEKYYLKKNQKED